MLKYELKMLNKVTSLVHILSLSAVIDSLQFLHGQPPLNYRRLYGNNTNGSKLMNIIGLSIGILDFLEQSQRFRSQNILDMTSQYGDTFDFIVISAGTTGATSSKTERNSSE